MSRLEELQKWLSEADYKTVDAENQINPGERHHKGSDEYREIQKQEHVTSSGKEAWLDAPEGDAPSTSFGLKKPGLVPYTSLVRAPGKTPYYATRWRKVEPKGGREEINIVPVEAFQGDLKQVYSAWKGFVRQKDESESQDLLLPLLGLQDFIEEGRTGILAYLGNRIIGLASIDVDDMGEARLSVLSAAPKEIEEGSEDYVEDALREGLETFAGEKEYNLITSSDANVGQEVLKKAFRTVRLAKAGFADREKVRLAAEAEAKGLVPKSGDKMNPDSWITEDEYVAQFGQEALDNYKNFGGPQGSSDPKKRKRGSYEKTKALGYISPEEAVKQGAKPGFTLGGFRIPDAAMGHEFSEVEIDPDPNALKQGRYKNAKDTWVGMYTKTYVEQQALIKYGRGREFATDMPTLMDFINQEQRNGSTEAEVLKLMAMTSLRIGNAEDTNPEERHYGATTLLGKHVKLEGSKVELHFVGKDGQDIDLEYDNQELAEMLWARMKKQGFKPSQPLYPVTDDRVSNYMKLNVLPSTGLEEKGYLPKDFRTHGARSMTVEAMSKMNPPTNAKQFKKTKKAIAVAVARGLGNDPETAMKSYIDPVLFADWESGLEDFERED